MRAVVTGSAGFIGSYLAEALLARGDEVLGIDSLTTYYEPRRKRTNLETALGYDAFTFVEEDLNELDLAPHVDGADVVFHLAGQPGVRASWGTEFDVYLEENVLTTQRLLEAVRTSPVRKFVLASSSSIYGQAERFPTTEDDRPRPISPYGVTKLAAEHLCSLYHAAYDVPAVMLRYFTVFGPRQRPDMAFNRFIAHALAGRPLPLIGDGLQSRDFTYVADAVQATIAAADAGLPGRVYNVAGGCQATVLEVVDTIEHLLRGPVEREHLPPVPGDPRKTGADVSRAIADLGYSPTTSLEEGLSRQLEHARATA